MSIPLPSSPRSRVLVIEEDESSRHLMQVVLELNGYDVVTVTDAEQAWASIEALPFDLVLLNIGLPVNDGLALLSQLRAQPALCATPIIVTTAYGVSSFRAQTLAAGGDSMLLKPIDLDELESTIQYCLSKQHPSA
ncbi:MAG: response regulator [Blastocatellia bacterium]